MTWDPARAKALISEIQSPHWPMNVGRLIDMLEAAMAEIEKLEEQLAWQGAITEALVPYQERAVSAESLLADALREGLKECEALRKQLDWTVRQTHISFRSPHLPLLEENDRLKAENEALRDLLREAGHSLTAYAGTMLPVEKK